MSHDRRKFGLSFLFVHQAFRAWCRSLFHQQIRSYPPQSEYTHIPNVGICELSRQSNRNGFDCGILNLDVVTLRLHIYMYTYYAYVYINISIYIDVHIYVYMNIYICIYICTHIFMYKYTYIYIHAYIYVYKYVCVYTCICIFTYVYIGPGHFFYDPTCILLYLRLVDVAFITS